MNRLVIIALLTGMVACVGARPNPEHRDNSPHLTLIKWLSMRPLVGVGPFHLREDRVVVLRNAREWQCTSGAFATLYTYCVSPSAPGVQVALSFDQDRLEDISLDVADLEDGPLASMCKAYAEIRKDLERAMGKANISLDGPCEQPESKVFSRSCASWITPDSIATLDVWQNPENMTLASVSISIDTPKGLPRSCRPE
jgi:hypothetical protein